MIKAVYLVKLQQPYKLTKLLSKFEISVKPYPCKFEVKDKDGANQLEIFVHHPRILGELNRRLKLLKNCQFQAIEVSNDG
jgi:hypothetical protein